MTDLKGSGSESEETNEEERGDGPPPLLRPRRPRCSVLVSLLHAVRLLDKTPSPLLLNAANSGYSRAVAHLDEDHT